MMAEAFGVIFIYTGKWFKAGKTDRTRRIGFVLASLASVYFVVYFFSTHQYWLGSSSLLNVGICVRGFINNLR